MSTILSRLPREVPRSRYSNLQTVCRDCHRVKTLQFMSGRRTLDALAL